MMPAFERLTRQIGAGLGGAVMLLALGACEAPPAGEGAKAPPAQAPGSSMASGTGFLSTTARDTSAFDFEIPANVPSAMRPFAVYSTNRAVAQTLAFNCPGVDFRSGLDSRTINSMIRDMISAGVREVDVRRTASTVLNEQLDGQLSAYAFSRGIVDGKPETFCAAARSEIASGSGIGNLLRPL